MEDKCYACARRFRKNTHGRTVYHPEVLTIDGQRQTVGYDCYNLIQKAGIRGYQPPLGGPRLFTEMNAPAHVLAAAGITIVREVPHTSAPITGADLAEGCEGEEIADLIDLALAVRDDAMRVPYKDAPLALDILSKRATQILERITRRVQELNK